MIYNIGDELKCTHSISTKCLEMTNHDIEIQPGDIYIVTDKDDYPEKNDCHWYELTSKDKTLVLNAWNDAPDHMVIDDNFVKVSES